MKTIPLLTFGCYWIYSLLFFSPQAPISSLQLSIDNLQSGLGTVHVALYDREETFAKSLKPFRLNIYDLSSNLAMPLLLDSLPYGRYAVAIYHDENGNGDLDKNIFGIPVEPYGFSNNPRAKWSAPNFEDISFTVDQDPLKLSVTVKRWKKR